MQTPHPPPKQPQRIGPAFALRIAENTLSSARQLNRSPVELVMVKPLACISGRLSTAEGIRHVDDEIFLPANHLALADFD